MTSQTGEDDARDPLAVSDTSTTETSVPVIAGLSDITGDDDDDVVTLEMVNPLLAPAAEREP